MVFNWANVSAVSSRWRITVGVIPNPPRNFKYQYSTTDMPTIPKSAGERSRTTTSKAAQDTNWLDQFATARQNRLTAKDSCFLGGAIGAEAGLVCAISTSPGVFDLSKRILLTRLDCKFLAMRGVLSERSPQRILPYTLLTTRRATTNVHPVVMTRAVSGLAAR